MSQSARAKSDDFNNTWSSPTGVVYSQINGTSAKDSTYVTCASPYGKDFKVMLAGMAWPADGPETLTVRLRGPNTVVVTVILYQATTPIGGVAGKPVPGSKRLLVLGDDRVSLINDQDHKISCRAQVQGQIVVAAEILVGLVRIAPMTRTNNGHVPGSIQNVAIDASSGKNPGKGHAPGIGHTRGVQGTICVSGETSGNFQADVRVIGDVAYFGIRQRKSLGGKSMRNLAAGNDPVGDHGGAFKKGQGDLIIVCRGLPQAHFQCLRK